MFDAMKISASGLTAESLRLDVISNNLANIDTTQTPQGDRTAGSLWCFRQCRPLCRG